MYLKHWFSLILCLLFVSSVFLPQAQGFIEREYTIHEVLEACTNIVFGKVKSADARRFRAVVTVEEDVKGKCNLKEIRINFATGRYRRESTPQKMLRGLKTGLPVIVFYQKTYGIASMGYVNGMWFQTHARSESPTEWWQFNHIDPMMLRTFSGSTEEFQKTVRAILAGEKWVGTPEDGVKVLVLTGNSTEPMSSQFPVSANKVGYEYHTIRSMRKTGDRSLAYESTKDRSLPALDRANILWLGYGEIASGGYLFNQETEEKVRLFVKSGGIVIVSGQESTPEQLCQTGWLGGSLKAIDRPPTQEFKITERGTKLFSEPNPIQPGQLSIQDSWTDWDKGFETFATSSDGKDLVLGVRKDGKGLYIITSLQNDNQGAVTANEKLIENIIHYAVNSLR